MLESKRTKKMKVNYFTSKTEVQIKYII